MYPEIDKIFNRLRKIEEHELEAFWIIAQSEEILKTHNEHIKQGVYS